MKIPERISSVEGLQDEGFAGLVAVADLRLGQEHTMPASPGVYLFIRNRTTPPRFLAKGTGGRFKNKDPNVTKGRLFDEWVDGALIVYVGKTDGTLRDRIGAMIKFGQGRPVAHRGGRLVWQLDDANRLQVCWKETGPADPRSVERALIEAFKSLHGGRRPFANLQD